MKTGNNSYDKWSLTGQNRGEKTEKQLKQSEKDKRRYQESLTRSHAVTLLKPPVIVKPFSILDLPGIRRNVLEIIRPDGKPCYFQTESGPIIRRPAFV
jgi:hypothetical protein